MSIVSLIFLILFVIGLISIVPGSPLGRFWPGWLVLATILVYLIIQIVGGLVIRL